MANRFNLDYDIPKTRTVDIYVSNGKGGTQKLIDQPLLLDDEISIKASSKFGQLWEASPNNFLNLLSSATNGVIPSGQFALQGTQIWQSTDPLSMSLSLSLEMDTDPYTDVVAPTFILTQTCLPKINSSVKKSLDGLVEEHLNIKLKTLIPAGPNLQSIIKMMKSNSDSADFLAGKDGLNGTYNIRIGFVWLNNVIITRVEPTFSKTVSKSRSKDGKLFPIKSNISLELTTMEIATTDMISQTISSF